MKIKKELVKRDIAGESFLIPLGKTVYDTNGLFVLTEVGAFLWDRLPQAEDEAALVRAVLEEYEVDEATAVADIAEFLAKLRKLEIL
jgi:hypothetical protein